MSSSQRVKVILMGLFLVFALVLASCEERAAVSFEVTSARINAWEGGPPDGSELPLGENPVLCHFFAVAGVASGELVVNGAFADRAVNPDPGAQYFSAELTFQAGAPGSYVLECVVFDQDGLNARSVPVTVSVGGEAETPTPTTPPAVPTATSTETEVPPEAPTATSTSTGVPTNTPTSTARPVDTPTFTPTSTATTQARVVITMFEANKTQIMLGECPVTFSWQVQAPTAIYFDGQGVTSNPGSGDRCPTSTRSYELVAHGYLGPVTESITIVVIQPSDTEGPNIGRVGHSPGKIFWDQYDSCSPPTYPIETTINAYNITDPSGVDMVKVAYRVVEGKLNGQWQTKAMSQVQTGVWSATIGPNDLELSLNPPVSYGVGNTSTLEYYIQAFDGVGNRSDSSTRTLIVECCILLY